MSGSLLAGEGGLIANAERIPKRWSGISVAQFRQLVRAFNDPQLYTEAQIIPYLRLSDQSMPADRWGEFRDIGQAMFVAHFLALDAREDRQSAAGGEPGSLSSGATISSKSVGGASISYDISSITEQGGGFWNMTSYGLRWLRFARMIGMGGMQSGGPDIILGNTFGPAWQGVVYR